MHAALGRAEGLHGEGRPARCPPRRQSPGLSDCPNGEEHWVSGKYLEVLPPRRLVFTHAWELANGERSPETVVTVDLTEKDGATQMRFHQAFFESVASRDGHEGGWTESFERLARFLDTDFSGASKP
ncbi:activator of Hsp90 ATPase-like protein [Rhizobium sp. BK376]|nr:activator of Hsp90 ATPase-like protein [Rhizobium sp. BK376]